MKNAYLSTFLFLLLTISVNAIDKRNFINNETSTSYAAQNSFDALYHNAENVTWSNVDGYHKASFTLEGVKKSAFFNAQGEYVATTQYISGNMLPAATLEKLKNVYKDYTLGEVLLFETNGAQSTYIFSNNEESNYYFASLRKDDNQIVVKISSRNEISFFKKL